MWLLLLFSCPDTNIVNSTELKWIETDQITLEYAKKRCPEIYIDAPCLTYFEKYEYNSYRALCGGEL